MLKRINQLEIKQKKLYVIFAVKKSNSLLKMALPTVFESHVVDLLK